MQYKNYVIHYIDEGCVVNDEHGRFIVATCDERDAMEYVDQLELDDKVAEIRRHDWYAGFEMYCRNLPGKCYPLDKRMCTTNVEALERFIKSYEEATSTKIITHTEYIDDELFCVVDDVIPQ